MRNVKYKLVAACNSGHGIYISTNSGSTWVNTYNGREFGGEFWHSVAISADGTKLVAAEGDGYVAGYPPYSCMVACSTNSGVSWWISSAPTNQLWWAVACSTDGSFMVAAALESYARCPAPGPIYVSHDSGVTWTPTTAPLATWGSLACSADGTRVTAGTIAAAISTTIGACYSIDSGTNWTVDTNLFGAESLASSSDGSTRVAAEGYLYVSHIQPGFSIPQAEHCPFCQQRPALLGHEPSWRLSTARNESCRTQLAYHDEYPCHQQRPKPSFGLALQPPKLLPACQPLIPSAASNMIGPPKAKLLSK